MGFAPAEAWSARSFASRASLALLTPFGPFDVWLRPDAAAGYDDLIESAVDVEADGLTAKAILLEDSIRIKRAIGDPKDRAQLPLLREVQRRRRARGLD